MVVIAVCAIVVIYLEYRQEKCVCAYIHKQYYALKTGRPDDIYYTYKVCDRSAIVNRRTGFRVILKEKSKFDKFKEIW